MRHCGSLFSLFSSLPSYFVPFASFSLSSVFSFSFGSLFCSFWAAFGSVPNFWQLAAEADPSAEADISTLGQSDPSTVHSAAESLLLFLPLLPPFRPPPQTAKGKSVCSVLSSVFCVGHSGRGRNWANGRRTNAKRRQQNTHGTATTTTGTTTAQTTAANGTEGRRRKQGID
jgi:hypothetical protein